MCMYSSASVAQSMAHVTSELMRGIGAPERKATRQMTTV